MSLARATFTALTFLATAMLAAAPSLAQERIAFGPFYYLPEEPDRLYLDGPIGEGSAQALADNLDDLASVETLVLNSPFGTIVDGLVIAEIVRSERINTFVPAGAHCGGPCFFIFMAGIGRTAYGTLSADDGINEFSERFFPDHQIWAIENEALAGYGASDELLALFWGLRGNGEHRFTTAEMSSLGLYRSQSEGTAQVGETPGPTVYEDARVLEYVPSPLDPSTLPDYGTVGEPITALMGVTHANGDEETLTGVTQWAGSADPLRPFAVAVTDFLNREVGFIVLFVPSASRDGSSAGDVVAVGIMLGGNATWPAVTQVVGPIAFNPAAPDNIQRIFALRKRTDLPWPQDGYRTSQFELLIPRAYAPFAWRLMGEERFTALSFGLFLEDGSEWTLLIPISNEVRSVFQSIAGASLH